MGKLTNFGKVWVGVHARDHNPPHVHLKGAGVRAMVAIDPVTILRGKVPSDLWPQVQAWAIANRATLVAEWNKCNPLYPTV